MKKGWIKSAGIEIDRLAPLALLYVICPYKVIIYVKEPWILTMHIGIDEVKTFFRFIVAKSRSPYTLGRFFARKVEIFFCFQGMSNKLPMHKIPGMIDWYSGEPFKG
jgi:hypothetical protein